ncbi:hypothetical protein PSPO01_04963 [Paraphaeosphaeria sporulosa]
MSITVGNSDDLSKQQLRLEQYSDGNPGAQIADLVLDSKPHETDKAPNSKQPQSPPTSRLSKTKTAVQRRCKTIVSTLIKWSIWLFQLNHRWNADTKVEAPSMKRPRKWLSLPPDGQSTMAASMIFDQTQFMCIVDPKAGVMQCVYKFEDIRRQKKTAGENSTGAALQTS